MLNRKAVRKYILDKLETTRPYLNIKRVSDKKGLDVLEAKFRAMVDREIAALPSVGKTFMIE